MKMSHFERKEYKGENTIVIMNLGLLRSIVFILATFFFISSVSAGNVIFRDGKIISSGNVSTDEKFIGDGSEITNLNVPSVNPFNQDLNTTSNVTFDRFISKGISINLSNYFNFGAIDLIGDDKKWQITHRNESNMGLKNNLLFYYFNGTNWDYGFKITPGLKFGFGNRTFLDNVTLNEKLTVFGNVNITGNIIIDNKITWNQQYLPAITQEVAGLLLDFGVNYNQSGNRNYSALGGFLRIDTRGNNIPILQVGTNPIGWTGGGGNETYLLELRENGDLNITGTLQSQGIKGNKNNSLEITSLGNQINFTMTDSNGYERCLLFQAAGTSPSSGWLNIQQCGSNQIGTISFTPNIKLNDDKALGLGGGNDFAIGYSDTHKGFKIIKGNQWEIASNAQAIIYINETNSNVGINTIKGTTTLFVNGTTNSTGEMCVQGGKCLNKTIEVFTNNGIIDGSLAYYNATNSRWIMMNETANNGETLNYCGAYGLKWLSGIEACPI